MISKCKIVDIVEDLTKRFNISEISMDESGVGIGLADGLRDRGVLVNIHKISKPKLKVMRTPKELKDCTKKELLRVVNRLQGKLVLAGLEHKNIQILLNASHKEVQKLKLDIREMERGNKVNRIQMIRELLDDMESCRCEVDDD